MRRINQRYLLATKTSVDVSAVKLPENINDDYFKVRQVFISVFKLLLIWKENHVKLHDQNNFTKNFYDEPIALGSAVWHPNEANFKQLSLEHKQNPWYSRCSVFNEILLLQHAKAPKAKKTEGGDIFAAKKEEYKVSDARKADQETVDKQVLDAIKKHPEGASLKAYMKAIFSLSKGQFPHTMAF